MVYGNGTKIGKGDSKKTRGTFEKEPRYFRKFKVALNPMYKIFLNFAKSCVLSCLSKVDNIKKFHRAVF